MKIIQDPRILPDDFRFPDREKRKEGYTFLAEHNAVHHSYLSASSLYENAMLFCDTVSRYRLLPGHRGWLIRPDFLSLRLVAEGTEYVRYDGKKYRMEPGDLMIFHPFHDYEYATGNTGFCEKYSITMKGSLLTDLLKRSALSDVFCIRLEQPEKFIELHTELEELLKKKGLPDPAAGSGLCMELLQVLAFSGNAKKEPGRLNEIRQYIEQHPDRPLTLEHLAGQFGLCASGISRLFRNHLDTSVHRYVIQTRMEQARVRMLEQGLSVKETAERCGFSNPFNFSTEFKKYHGLSPRMFLRRFRPGN